MCGNQYVDKLIIITNMWKPSQYGILILNNNVMAIICINIICINISMKTILIIWIT